MATEASACNLVVVDTDYRDPGCRYMANVTGIGGAHMACVLAGGCSAVMAIDTATNDFDVRNSHVYCPG